MIVRETVPELLRAVNEITEGEFSAGMVDPVAELGSRHLLHRFIPCSEGARMLSYFEEAILLVRRTRQLRQLLSIKCSNEQDLVRRLSLFQFQEHSIVSFINERRVT